MIRVFINGTGSIAPQQTLEGERILETPVLYEENCLQILKPNYRDYIEPKVLRRMSKIVRMAVVSAKVALEEASLEQPDAIVTGTGMGCQVDTEKFLNGMLDNNETLLNPTAFIQSTHNTMGAQIALMLGNNNHNLTYVHRTFSFESALLDALMMLNEKQASNVLLGGIDEITEESWLIKTRIGHYKSLPVKNLELLKDEQTGALAGESSSFFVLSDKPGENRYGSIADSTTFFKPKNVATTLGKINDFLAKNHLSTASLDLVIMGYNGDRKFDAIYTEVEKELFEKVPVGYFKHLCGEHDTSSAFAVWIAAHILRNGHVPEIILKRDRPKKQPKNILIYNQFRNVNHSLILLGSV